MCKILCHEGHELDSGDLQDLLQIDAEVGDRVAGAGDPAGIGWRLYERLAAAIEAEGAGIDGSVTLNARVRGSVSGRWRQVDMLMDTRWEDGAGRRVIFDAKMRRQPVDINDVESFEGMMRDCSAKHGVIICSSGWTAGAERRAQDAITIKLLTIEEADKWSPHFTPCMGKCDDRRGLKVGQHGLVLWDGQLGLAILGLWVPLHLWLREEVGVRYGCRWGERRR
jgi:hypothetical protein